MAAKITKTYGACACGCGEGITHQGSSYAGVDEAERNRHRARAAYRRKAGQQAIAGTKESMAALGMADDVPVAELAATVAAVMTELAGRVAGMDQAAINREIDAGLAEAHAKVDEAEARAAKAETLANRAGDELDAAVRRADQADEDAAKAGARAEELQMAIETAGQIERDRRSEITRLNDDLSTAVRRAERAENIVDEVRRTAEADSRLALAELRAELAGELGELRAELTMVRAERDSWQKRAERTEPPNTTTSTRTTSTRAKKAAPAAKTDPTDK